jgi:hypothetical protein
MRAQETAAIFWPEGTFRVGGDESQSSMPTGLDTEAEEGAARDLLAAAQAAGVGVIDMLAAGHPVSPMLDRRMVTALALISEQEQAGGNSVGPMSGLQLTAGPAAGMVDLSTYAEHSDPLKKPSKSDKPAPALGAPLGIPGEMGGPAAQ